MNLEGNFVEKDKLLVTSVFSPPQCLQNSKTFFFQEIEIKHGAVKG